MLINDHFQNFKRYQIPKAQLIIADIPYNIGKNAYGSNPSWYIGGDNKNGESELAGTEFFDTDKNFRPAEFMHFCSKMLKKEPKQRNAAPAMIVFCSFEQQFYLIELAKRYGLNNYINLVFRKNFSAQVLKANMRIVGNAEYGLLLYRDKLPKFRNNGKMIFNIIDWDSDKGIEKIHPCLPAGEKVYFNNKWINIEDVKKGDKNCYGTVIDTSNHIADYLIEIIVNGKKTIATYNHPFLVKRNKKIFWVEAEKIKKNDEILKRFLYTAHRNQKNFKKWNTRKQKKGILGLSILLYGKDIMGKSLWACKFIIKMATKRITTFQIYNLSHPLNTNGITLVADLTKTENGKSRAKNVENLKLSIKKIGIFQEVGLMVNYVKNAISKNQSKQENYLLQKVGSVKIIRKKTKVYNLTMSNIPAFETNIGISHNTQKPIKLIEKLIKTFTDDGDVVIDPVAGSGTTLIAAENLNRKAYGFEIKKDFYRAATGLIEKHRKIRSEIKELGFAKTELKKIHPTLWD